MSNTRTIAKNTAWYGIDNLLSAIVALSTSIAIARALGPSKTGYIVYVSYIASVVSRLGTLGIAAAARKYMAEFLGMGDKGTARYIFFRTLALQVGLGTASTIGIVVWVLSSAESEYKLASLLIGLSIWPTIVTAVPAQANVATEDMAANLPASIVSALGYFLAVLCTVIFHWGVVGIGASLLLMRSLDFLVLVFPAVRRILAWEAVPHIPPGLRKRMIAFSWKSVASMILSLVIWERSEVLLLKSLCADIRQVAFYSIAFSMANQLLITAIVFGAAASTTIFAQYGRDKSKLPGLAASSFRYIALTSIPIHFIVSSLAVPALIVFYGRAYTGAAAVFTLAPLLCLPKAFLAPIQNFLFSIERQNHALLATIVGAALDISVAWALIPKHGAVGACIGSGVAQFTAIGIMWTIGVSAHGIHIPWKLTVKVVVSSVVASALAYFVAAKLGAFKGLFWGSGVASIALLCMFYFLRVLEREDLNRFDVIFRFLPASLARRVSYCISAFVRDNSGPEVVEI